MEGEGVIEVEGLARLLDLVPCDECSTKVEEDWSCDRLKLAFSPPPVVSKQSTGLTFTDILFGFVIKELFSRLQYWGTEPGVVRWQLITGITLVLGSWIGFRRSLSRSSYELKFFNIPLLRFAFDQGMLIMYFRVAILTPESERPKVSPLAVAHTTTKALLVIFVLYFLWDLAGLGMRWRGYKKIDPKTDAIMAGDPFPRNLAGSGITAVFLLIFAGLYVVTKHMDIHTQQAEVLFLVAAVLLLAYRFAKEVRTSLSGGTGSAEGEPALATQSA
jgi:hypothetical protein